MNLEQKWSAKLPNPFPQFSCFQIQLEYSGLHKAAPAALLPWAELWKPSCGEGMHLQLLLHPLTSNSRMHATANVHVCVNALTFRNDECVPSVRQQRLRGGGKLPHNKAGGASVPLLWWRVEFAYFSKLHPLLCWSQRGGRESEGISPKLPPASRQNSRPEARLQRRWELLS